MQPDPEYLRRHYNSLSDEALLDIDRSELTEIAQQCYDAELGARELGRSNAVRRGAEARAVPESLDDPEPYDPEERPDWLDEASEAFSVVHSHTSEEQIANVQEALKAARIPCYLELCEASEEERPVPPPTRRWRVLVPGTLNLRAMSTLQRDLFNPEFETGWKAHLEALSDEELLATSPEAELCDLFDRVDRAARAYDEEVVRRRLRARAE